MGGHSGGWLFGGFMWLWWLLPLILIIGLAALMGGSGKGTGPTPRDEALETLRQRLARGEIDTEEYERLKRELES